MVDVVTDLVQRGVTADEVDQGNSATVATLAENADEPDKKILLVGELIDFAFEGAPTTLIGTPVEGTFDFALDAVGTGHGTCALGTSVWMLAMEATHGGACAKITLSFRVLQAAQAVPTFFLRCWASRAALAPGGAGAKGRDLVSAMVLTHGGGMGRVGRGGRTRGDKREGND